jgi:hypothetical protein
MVDWLLNARDTVETDTPAFAAISFIVTMGCILPATGCIIIWLPFPACSVSLSIEIVAFYS